MGGSAQSYQRFVLLFANHRVVKISPMDNSNCGYHHPALNDTVDIAVKEVTIQSRLP